MEKIVEKEVKVEVPVEKIPLDLVVSQVYHLLCSFVRLRVAYQYFSFLDFHLRSIAGRVAAQVFINYISGNLYSNFAQCTISAELLKKPISNA